MPTRRVAHQYDSLRIAAELMRVLLHPRDSQCAVVEEERKFHLRIEPIVGQHSDYSSLRERCADKAVEPSAADGP